MPTGKLNEFVIRCANVNGTGSASANTLLAKAFYRMGLPIAAKNMFPSNIQGLPTWYEIRVSEAGHTGRRGSVDLVVAMNPQSFKDDVASVESGGYLLYDSTRPFDPALRRDDITFLGLPFIEMVQQHEDQRKRLLFKNICYVGALSALLDIEFDVLTGLLDERFKGKEKLIAPNVEALKAGREAALAAFECPLPIRAERRDAVGDGILITGNEACALGCVYAGATVAAWYPITPSTSLAEAFGHYCEKLRVDPESGRNNFAIVQAEDELSAIGVVIGASWNGARSFTATSGPGVSLMSEFLGLAYYAEIPTVLFDVQRAGPSTGMPTRTQQADLLSAAYASHGDTKHVLLFPASPDECFELAVRAFDLADRLQTPVIVMSDLDLGMNTWLSRPFKWDDARRPDRGKVLGRDELEAGKQFYRYLDVDGDGIPYRTYPGTHPSRGAYFTRGSGHDKYGAYTEDSDKYQENLDRLRRKFDTAAQLVPKPVMEAEPGSEAGVLYFGTTTEPMREALEGLAKRGVKLDAMRLLAFPFSEEVYRFIDAHKTVFVVEQNRDAQLHTMLLTEGGMDPAQLVSVLHYGGLPVTADFLIRSVLEHLASAAGQPAAGAAS
ncbi:MAG TPA: 2-oxoacid:acceptor oxidoreductase subunit alpha [Gammaproteobacteria bacterium]|nr:2-oxoacid:acceptor oxidoreductase subunit alpha [Gammaproteobacteria bacterium]